MNNLRELERITTVKAIICDVDLNFLDISDLEEIQELFYDLGIEEYFTDYDLEEIYDFEFDEMESIYQKWYDEVIIAFNNIEDKLEQALNHKN